EKVPLEDPHVKWTIKIFTMKYLCQTLLIEVAHDNNPSLLVEIDALIDKILKIAKKQHLNSIEIETMIFKSKLELINGNIPQAQLLLSRATSIANDYKLNQMIKLVEQERTLLSNDFEIWQELQRPNSSMQERIKQAEITEYLQLALELKDRTAE
ncbi:MAG: hypothetical protein ACC656_09505, partial [Candidatus Heimdallarchaeota archaeon]